VGDVKNDIILLLIK